MIRSRNRIVLLGMAALAAAVAAVPVAGLVRKPAGAAEPRAGDEPKTDAATERARQQVMMLDDLYKTAVVSITARYGRELDDQPAIMVAQDVFAAMKKKGWHSAKLVDATGEPKNVLNAPQTDFEKAAAKAILAGKPYFEQVEGRGESRKLLAATVVPAVSQRCADCHDRKLGEVLGFLRYSVPIK